MASAFFCPACWDEVPRAAERCQGCGADLAALDAADFDDKLERALWHPEAGTRLRAVEILGRRRVAWAVPRLVERLRDADPYLGAEIARSLGRIGGPDALAVLRDLSGCHSVIIRRAARKALAEGGE